METSYLNVRKKDKLKSKGLNSPFFIMTKLCVEHCELISGCLGNRPGNDLEVVYKHVELRNLSD